MAHLSMVEIHDALINGGLINGAQQLRDGGVSVRPAQRNSNFRPRSDSRGFGRPRHQDRILAPSGGGVILWAAARFPKSEVAIEPQRRLIRSADLEIDTPHGRQGLQRRL